MSVHVFMFCTVFAGATWPDYMAKSMWIQLIIFVFIIGFYLYLLYCVLYCTVILEELEGEGTILFQLHSTTVHKVRLIKNLIKHTMDPMSLDFNLLWEFIRRQALHMSI